MQTRYIPEGKEWPPNQPKYYVNLAVIHFQATQTQEEMIFSSQHCKHINLQEGEFLFSRSTNQQSKLPNKFKLKVTREIVDLFSTNHCVDKIGVNTNFEIPKSILVEGAPGIGKTMLLKEIAYRWANGIILNNARIVFLIYLRDSRFHSVTTLYELIRHFDCLEENEIPVVVKRLKQSNGEGVIFLIDGLDEYPGALKNDFLTCLIDRKILSKCVYVITSQPCASLSLHSKVERRIEILGFGNEEQNEYISMFLKSSPEKQKELEKYLKLHPILNSLVYIPFHLSVLLFLFQQGNLPETLTEMNESFILHTVYRHMEKHDVSTPCIIRLGDFPETVHKIIHKLSNLAFEGLLSNKLIFTFDEIKQVCPEVDIMPGALHGFGLLQAVQHYPIKGAGTTITFNFLHLTMQEFLAAWYISHCSVEQQKQLLKESFMQGELRDNGLIDPDTLNDSVARMWQMYLGIVKVNCNAWIQFTNECSISLDKFTDPIKYLYYFQCLLEGTGDSEIVPVFTSAFYCNTMRFTCQTLLPYHIALLCMYLSKSPKQWKYFDFWGSVMGDVGIKLLANFLLENKEI